MILILVIILLCLGFCWLKAPLKNWLIASVVLLFVTFLSGLTQPVLTLIIIIMLVGLWLVLYLLHDVRRQFLSNRLLRLVKNTMPEISQTERDAIEAGDVWWDAELFSGSPDWKVLLDAREAELSDTEKKFIDTEVQQLCEISDDWEITHELNDLPESIWQAIREGGFFGLNVSKEYGGLGFSARAQSIILQKLSSRSASVAVTVMVPNSLGPAELLYHYGNDKQKASYLPDLASGKEVPCFGLTGPWAGSDAGGMPDYGTVCKEKIKGKEILGFKVNWEKRYITLGPVSTLIGLAFKTHDPDQLLGLGEYPGITCALVPAGTKGITIGARHYPLNAAFQNGPNWGEEVFVPLDWVIGGEQQVGKGWKMLMDSLAAGRGISLPAAGAGTAKMAARTTGAYARIREQFGIEIGRFEGVQEALGRIGGLTYLLDSARHVTTIAIDMGIKPAILSAITKQQCTDLSRQVINDAMDVHGGRAICMGPSNYLARAYQQIPIGITVEGANILTRSLIIFGQGAMRCHPYLLQELEAVSSDDEVDALEVFDKLLVQHLEHLIECKIRCFGFGLSRSKLATGTGKGQTARYTRIIEHFSAALAYVSDITLFILGSDLKKKEMLSGRFADVLGNLYLASAAVKKFKDNGSPEREEPLLNWACQYALFQVQQALDGIFRNFPVRGVGIVLRFVVFPTGRYVTPPSDEMSTQVAAILQRPGVVRQRLTEEVYISEQDGEPLFELEQALLLMDKSAALRKRLARDGQQPEPTESYLSWLQRIEDDQTISTEEGALLKSARDAVSRVIQVDSFQDP